MDKIILSNLGTVVQMPRVKDVKVGAQEVARTVTMASGRVVKDMIGYRPVVTASWDWVPATTILALVRLLKKSAFVYVEYPSPEGAQAGWFEIEYPTMSVFRYNNGVAVWHDVTLVMTAQEVRK